MRVLYVGTLNRHGTCYSRLQALREMEREVSLFDIDPYLQAMSRLRLAVEHRLFIGPGFTRMNADLLSRFRELKPDIIWVDKGFWVWPSTLRTLRKKGAVLVHSITDALWPRPRDVRWRHTLLRKTIPYYHIFFTTNLDDCKVLSGKVTTAVELTLLGYDHERFNNAPLSPDVQKKWRSQLLFIGHYEPRTEDYITALVDAQLPVTVYGTRWNRARNKQRLRDHVRFQPVWGQDYVNALKATEIGLCFVSEWNYNQTAARSFEIPACGTFLLAMRTPRHLECYQEGVEAEFFGDPEELVKKARFYLENPEQREEIARRGHQRCVNSGYSWADYMRHDWAKVRAAFAEHKFG